MYTLHFDGSHNNQENKAGAGCIIRDSQGELVVAAAYNLSKSDLPCYNVAIAEAMGLKNGLVLAQQGRYKLNVIKGDNKEVIDLVRGQAKRRPGQPLEDIIVHIKCMLTQKGCPIEHIDRVNNEVADKLAHMGSTLPTECEIFTRDNYHKLPSKVAQLIQEEKVSNRTMERNDGEGSSLAMVGAAVAGIAMLGWGVLKLFSEETPTSSSSRQKIQGKAIKTKIPDFFTLQYFGSDRNQVQKARAGCIIRNQDEEFIVAAAYNLDDEYPDCNIAIAEAIALKNGLDLAKDYNIRLNLIQGRNVEVQHRLLGLQRRPSRFPELSTIIDEIKSALYNGNQIIEVDLQLVEEQVIEVARELATEGGLLRQDARVYETIRDLPPRLASLVNY